MSIESIFEEAKLGGLVDENFGKDDFEKLYRLIERNLIQAQPRRPYVHASSLHGLHELWLLVPGKNGTTEVLDGPEPWPKGWVEKVNSYNDKNAYNN